MSVRPSELWQRVTVSHRAIMLMVAFVALWVTVETLAAFTFRQYSPYQIVWTRYGVHLAFMLAIWGLRDPRRLVRTNQPMMQIARSTLMVGMPASLIIALEHNAELGTVMAVFWLAPLLVLALGWLLLGEAVPLPLWILAAVACIGAAVASVPQSVPSAFSVACSLGMALCFSLYIVLTRALRDESHVANLFYTALGAFIAFTPIVPFVWQTPGLHDLAILCAIGIIGYVTLLALDHMAAGAPVAASAPIACVQPIFAGALNWHHEGLMTRDALIAGVALILIATIFIWNYDYSLRLRTHS